MWSQLERTYSRQNCSGNSWTQMHLVFLIQTTQSVNQSINQAINWLISTQLWINRVSPRNQQKEMFQSARTQGLQMQLSKAKLKQMKSTGGILGLFIRFALAAQKSFIFPRVGGTQHASTVSESRSCQSVVFVLISCPHPPTTRALIQLH